MSANIKKIKIFFIISLLFITIGLVFGVMRLEGDYYWQKKYVGMQWLFLKTRIEYLAKNSAFFPDSSPNNLKSTSSQRYARSVPVLLYHGVIADPNWTPDQVNTRLSDFKDQMMLLKSLGYETVSLDDFLSFIEGNKKLPEKSFLLTFDDGRKDSYYPVDPILKALNYQAVMFVITGRSFDQNEQANTFHLDQTELRKMAESGRWEIESHTENGHDLEKIDAQGGEGHFLSNKLWLKYEGRIETDAEYETRIQNDLAQSKKDIEQNLHTKVKAFAYPFGDYGPGTVDFSASQSIILPTVQKIFPYSFYQARESEYAGNYPEKQYLIKRLNIFSGITPEALAALFLNSREKNVSEYDDNFASDKGWKEGWGKRQFKDGLMITGPTNSEDSSLTFLEGSYLWKNYTFKSDIQLIKGKSFALLARYKDGNNYASCDFADDVLSIDEHLDGIDKTLAQIPFSSDMFVSTNSAGITVENQNMSCLVNGKPVLNAVLNPKLANGGIGFKTWDNKLFNSELLVKRVSATVIGIAEGESFRGAITENK